MSKKTVLWLGYGDIASRCAARILAEDFELVAACRSHKHIDPAATLVRADLSDPQDLRRCIQYAPDYIVLTLTPDQRGEQGYRDSYLAIVQTLLQQLRECGVQPQHILYISSTSVYHQSDGSWVDESSDTTPARPTSQVLLDTENLLRNSEFTSTILRFSGIYGAGRHFLLRQVYEAKAGTEAWTNRIHVEDCANIIAFLLSKKRAGHELADIVLASDCEPVTSIEVRRWLAEQMARPASNIVLEPSAVKNKRCDNRALLALGYTFLFPSFRDGYLPALREFLQELEHAQQSQQQ